MLDNTVNLKNGFFIFEKLCKYSSTSKLFDFKNRSPDSVDVVSR